MTCAVLFLSCYSTNVQYTMTLLSWFRDKRLSGQLDALRGKARLISKSVVLKLNVLFEACKHWLKRKRGKERVTCCREGTTGGTTGRNNDVESKIALAKASSMSCECYAIQHNLGKRRKEKRASPQELMQSLVRKLPGYNKKADHIPMGQYVELLGQGNLQVHF